MYISEKSLEMEKRVEERYLQWNSNKTFKWSKDNIAKLIKLNDAIIKKEDELYSLLANVKNDLDTLLASGKKYYEAYDIDAYLSYEAYDYSTPTGSDDIMENVYCCTNFKMCMGIYTSVDHSLKTVEEYFMRDTNFNYDYPFRDFPDKEHKITRSLHWLIQQNTYTLEDLLYLNPDYFVPCIEIRN